MRRRKALERRRDEIYPETKKQVPDRPVDDQSWFIPPDQLLDSLIGKPIKSIAWSYDWGGNRKVEKMRKPLVMLSLIILGAGLSLSTAIPAHAVLITNICTAATYNGNHQCLNLWRNNQSNGAGIRYYHHGTGNPENKWAPADDGAVVGVNCGQPGQRICWPFTTGSGMNARYDGDNVYVFEYGPNPDWCMDQGRYDTSYRNGQMMLWQCDTSGNQQFVWTGSDYNVDVGATNRQWAHDGNQNNIPVWTSNAANVSDGAIVQMSHTCDQYCQFQFTAP